MASAAALAGTAGGAWFAHRWLHTPVGPVPAGALVVIPRGTGFSAAAERLGAVGVIRHPFLFRLLARYRGVDTRLRSGEYHFVEAMTPWQVLEQLLSPEAALRWVTVPEGVTARQVAEILETEGFGGRDVFTCVMRDGALLSEFGLPASGIEGYLFPDTYAFEWSAEPRDVIRTMLERFVSVSDSLAAERRAVGMSREEMVVLASVIEKETGDPAERPLIAGVFHNRLRLGMKLQSDPTVLYGRGRDWGRPLTRSDLERPTPYNTYVISGLPRGPIANPGRAALAAAVSPSATEALYFVSRNDGTHHFSTDLREHNRAVRRFQRGRGKGKAGAREPLS